MALLHPVTHLRIAALIVNTLLTYRRIAQIENCSTTTVNRVGYLTLADEQSKARRYLTNANRADGAMSAKLRQLTKAPDSYFGDANGNMYVHQLVYLRAHGLTKLPDDNVIHHINCDASDNRIENLAMMTRSDHALLHTQIQAQLRKEQRNEKLNTG